MDKNQFLILIVTKKAHIALAPDKCCRHKSFRGSKLVFAGMEVYSLKRTVDLDFLMIDIVFWFIWIPAMLSRSRLTVIYCTHLAFSVKKSTQAQNRDLLKYTTIFGPAISSQAILFWLLLSVGGRTIPFISTVQKIPSLIPTLREGSSNNPTQPFNQGLGKKG